MKNTSWIGWKNSSLRFGCISEERVLDAYSCGYMLYMVMGAN